MSGVIFRSGMFVSVMALCALVAGSVSMKPGAAQTVRPDESGTSAALAAPNQTYRAFLPRVTGGFTCPATSINTYELTQFIPPPYKDNRLTDENADFRLSIISYTLTSQPLTFVDYPGGGPNADGPRLHGIFEPNRLATFVRAYQVHHWNWDESAPPPYGTRGSVNTDWPVSVLDLRSIPGENIHIPERTASITPAGHKAMVLYAGEREITLVYLAQDQVVVNGTGYVVHLSGFCVDPNLLALYRAQLDTAGRRATGYLPVLPNNKPIGRALTTSITVAVRDAAAFMDPRDQTDWWYFP